MIWASVDGRDVHERACDVLHARGHKTTKHDMEDGDPLTEGFTHDIGHGIGLEVHERPLVCAIGEELKEGDVIAVEPSLYYANLGGVCVEDLVLVTEEGCRDLTRFPKRFMLR